VVASLMFLSDCRPCEPNASPGLSVAFRGQKNYNSVKTIEPATVLYQDNFQNSFFLPLWVGAEKLSFVFANGISSDTLSVAYTRTFQFNSKSCGYQYKLSDLKVIKPNSFKNLVVDPFSFQIQIND